MLSERIKIILRETGTKIGALGEAAGISSGTASMWLTGQIKFIELQYAIKIQRKYGHNATWIVLGEGPKTLIPQSNNLSPSIQALVLRVGALSSQRRACIESIISACLVNAKQLDKLEAIEQGSNPVLAAEGARRLSEQVHFSDWLVSSARFSTPPRANRVASRVRKTLP